MKKLQTAFSKKEKAERLLSNLEDLKAKGEIEDDQYEVMKGEYSAVLAEGNSEIEAIKEGLVRASEPYRKDLEIYTQELKNLEMRINNPAASGRGMNGSKSSVSYRGKPRGMHP